MGLPDFFEVEGLSFENGVVIFSGSGNPSILNITAPAGSLFLDSSGAIYKKHGPLDTDWTVLTVPVTLEELVAIGSGGPELVFTDEEVIKVEV